MSPVPLRREVARSRELMSSKVHRRLVRAILDGTLVAGERLNDDDLCAWFGVSRTPIRTALERLADVGLVEMSPNRFTRIARPTPSGLRSALEVYTALHVAVVPSVLPDLSAADLESLYATSHRARAAVGRRPALSADGAAPPRWSRERLVAMGALVSFASQRCANPLLLSVSSELDLRLAFSFASLAVPVDREVVLACCDEIELAAERRDPGRFADALERMTTSWAGGVAASD